MDAQVLRELLPSLYAGNPDGILLYDRAGTVVAVNAAACDLLGSPASELVGRRYDDRRLGDRGPADSALQAALRGNSRRFATSFRRKDGSSVAVDSCWLPAERRGEVLGAFEQLRLPREPARTLFDYHPDAIASVGADGTIVRINAALESVTGNASESVAGRPWTELIAPEGRAAAEEAFREASRGTASAFDALLLDRHGDRTEVRMNVVPLRDGERVVGAYAIARDVAAQRRAERAIERQNERMRELYLVATEQGNSEAEQIDKTLALGCRIFGFEYGYLTEFDAGVERILNAVGEAPPVAPGMLLPMEGSLSQLLDDDLQTALVTEFDEPPWRTLFASKLVVGGRACGAIVFASHRERAAGLDESDRELIQLMGLFVCAILERAQHAGRIEHLAFFDSLTGLPNRVLFADRIRQTLAASKRYGHGFAVMYLDLDHFKEINDGYGHAVGDVVLKMVADRLLVTLRESDTIARFGGDEFVILQPVVKSTSNASDLASKLVAAMAEPLVLDGVAHRVYVSVGVALYPYDGDSVDELVEKADRALYRAKNAGRNRWVFFDEDASIGPPQSPDLRRREPADPR
ncbi:MAG: sensor domain-containing protein [Vulcanimicrobiaceae bacterium]